MCADAIPSVSAVVVSHNQARFVAEALASVSSQTYPAMHAVVVDDASSDGSQEIIRDWASAQDFPVHVIFNESRRGGTRSLNLGVDNATGDYVAFLAADDRWYPDKCSLQVAILAPLPPEYAVVYGDAEMIAEDGSRLGRDFIAGYRAFDRPPQGSIFCILVEGNFIPGPSALIRRSALSAIGPADERLTYEDWDLWLRLARRFQFAFCEGRIASYRVVAGSLSRSLSKDAWATTYIDALRKHVDADSCGDLIKSKIIQQADGLYGVGHPRGREYMRLAWQLDRTPFRAAKWLAAEVGVQATHTRTLRRTLGRVRGRRR